MTLLFPSPEAIVAGVELIDTQQSGNGQDRQAMFTLASRICAPTFAWRLHAPGVGLTLGRQRGVNLVQDNQKVRFNGRKAGPRFIIQHLDW